MLVSSGARVLALNLRTRKTTLYATARNYLLGIALAPDGWLYGSENVFGSEQTTLVRIRGGTREVLGEFHGVHGILVTADGLILSESYGGRVLHFDPETKTTEVLASGLEEPELHAPRGGRLVLRQRVLRRPHRPPLAGRAPDDRRPGRQAGPDRVRLAPPAGRRDAERDDAVPGRPRPGTARSIRRPSAPPTPAVMREELGRLWQLGGAPQATRRTAIDRGPGLTVVVDVVGRDPDLAARARTPTEPRSTSIGDAFFFTTVQLLTISSQLKNPLTAAGRVVDVGWRSGRWVSSRRSPDRSASFFVERRRSS